MSLQDLAAELDAPRPEQWKPKVGDKLVGILVRYGSTGTEFGAARTATLRDIAGKLWWTYINHAVLEAEFLRLNPQPGDEIGIAMIPTPPGKNYKNYRVVHKRGVGEPSAVAPTPVSPSGLSGERAADLVTAAQLARAAPGSRRADALDLASFSEPDWS